MNSVDPGVMRDPLGRTLVVAGHQDRLEPGLAQRGDGLDRIDLRRIAERQDAERAAIPGDRDHRAPLLL